MNADGTTGGKGDVMKSASQKQSERLTFNAISLKLLYLAVIITIIIIIRQGGTAAEPQLLSSGHCRVPHVLPVSTWVFSRFSGFLPPPQNMQISKQFPLGMNVFVHGAPRWTAIPSRAYSCLTPSFPATYQDKSV